MDVRFCQISLYAAIEMIKLPSTIYTVHNILCTITHYIILFITFIKMWIFNQLYIVKINLSHGVYSFFIFCWILFSDTVLYLFVCVCYTFYVNVHEGCWSVVFILFILCNLFLWLWYHSNNNLIQCVG